MANQLDIIVTAIDGNPFKENQEMSVLTSDILIHQQNIMGSQAIIQWYNNPTNPLAFQSLFVTADLYTLFSGANSNGTSMIGTQIISINNSPIPGIIGYLFPANSIKLTGTTEGTIIEFKGNSYLTTDSIATIVAAANAGGGGGVPTLQQVLDNNHYLTNGINLQGDDAGAGSSATQINAFGTSAGSSSSGTNINAFGADSFKSGTADNINAFGAKSVRENTGSSVNGLGFYAAARNSGNNINAFGYEAGIDNIYTSVNLFGNGAKATADNQLVLSTGTYNTRIGYAVNGDRLFEFPKNIDGEFALTSHQYIDLSSVYYALNPGMYVSTTGGTGKFYLPSPNDMPGQRITILNVRGSSFDFGGTFPKLLGVGDYMTMPNDTIIDLISANSNWYILSIKP